MIENINRQWSESAGPGQVNQLAPSDMYDLMAVQDLLNANQIASAREQMEKIAPEKRNHPSVLYLAYQVHAQAGDWDKAIQSADSLFQQIPDYPSAWIILADSASHKPAGSILESKEILIQAAAKFPDDYLILFKLAGYCAQLLQSDEARKWLGQAAKIGGERVNQMAMDDKNLASLLKRDSDKVAQ